MTPMPRDDHDRDAATGEIASTAPGAAEARAALSRQKMLTRATIGLGSVMGAIIAAPAAVAVLAPTFKQVKRILRSTSALRRLYPEVEPGRDSAAHRRRSRAAPDDGSGLARRLVYIRNDGNGTFTAISEHVHARRLPRCKPTRPDSPAPAMAASTTAREGAPRDRPCAPSTATTPQSTTGAI